MDNNLVDIIRNNSKELLPLPTGKIQFSNSSEKIKSIIFDIYGTLLISASGDIGTLKKNSRSDNFVRSLKKSGVQILTDQAGDLCLEIFQNEISKSHRSSIKQKIEFPEVVITEIWEKTLKKLIKEKVINIKLTNNLILQVATYFECYNNPVWPMPELVNVLNILNKKVVLGIVSNAQFYTPLLFKALTNLTLNDLGFDSKLIYFSYINKVAKPLLETCVGLVQDIIFLYNITPSNTLYVGNDMLNDIYSANKAGLKTALFAGDARSLRLREKDPKVTGINPDFLFTKLMQITELVK